MNNKIKAIFWDYDGTLVDTRLKNFNVAKNILQQVIKRDIKQYPIFQNPAVYNDSIRNYANWREFYVNEFGLSESETDFAGSLWTEYHLQDETDTPLFPGLDQVFDNLVQVPHAIISQNSSQSIKRFLDNNLLTKYFKVVIGYEEVELRRQKPEPDGLLLAIEKLLLDGNGEIFYIGDHETDILCARNANQFLKKNKSNITIRTIGAFYSHTSKEDNWAVMPDYIARKPLEIYQIVEGR
jgi:HAD superfamily hydrolase (TIGR01549 family)